MRRQIPNLLTLANLFFGMLAIAYTLEGNLEIAVYLIGACAVFDFMDGAAARLLKVTGPLGVQLDSLADVVSFGVLPAFMLSAAVSEYGAIGESMRWLGEVAGYAPYLIALASAYRLAIFNLDTRQGDRFLGLPTPANTLFIASVVWALDHDEWATWLTGLFTPLAVILLSVLSAWALLSRWPMLSLKFKSLKWKGNEARWILLALSLIILLWLGISGLSIVVLLYLLISIIEYRQTHEIPRRN